MPLPLVNLDDRKTLPRAQDAGIVGVTASGQYVGFFDDDAATPYHLAESFWETWLLSLPAQRPAICSLPAWVRELRPDQVEDC